MKLSESMCMCIVPRVRGEIVKDWQGESPTLANPDSLQWYDIVHFEDKLS